MKKVILLFALFTLFVTCFNSPTQKWRLIEFNNGQRVFMTQEQVEAMTNKPGKMINFADVTDTPNLHIGKIQHISTFPDKPRKQDEVKPFLQQIDNESQERLKATITHLSSYPTRHCRTKTGVEAAKWLASQFKEIISGLPAERQKLFSVHLFEHRGGWDQPSVTATFRGTTNESIVLGSHIDSTARGGKAPGADDNGSGSSSVLETFRLIAQSNFLPKRTVHFHSYAAEEIGLRGSREVVQQFKKDGAKVHSMMNLDMTGYNPNKNKVGLVTSKTSKTMNTFVGKLIDEYLKIGYVKRTLTFGSSDHASWTAAGYHACFPFEVVINPNIHTPRDTIEKLDLKNAIEWIKLAVSFIVELSQ